jgi:hypothetical protein
MQRLAFGTVALVTIVVAAATSSVYVGIGTLVPVSYALSSNLAAPYPDPRFHARIGVVSIFSFGALIAAVALVCPSDDLFDAAWYGYVSTSVVYALLMRSAPDHKDQGWMGRVHFCTTYVALIFAISFSCAVAIRVDAEGDDQVATGLAIFGAVLSAVLDGWFTAGWFFHFDDSDFVVRGRIFGAVVIVAFSGTFGDTLTTACAGIVAGAIGLAVEAGKPVDKRLQCPFLFIRSFPVALSIAATMLPHLYGLIAAGATASLGLITALVLMRPPGDVDSLLEQL